MTTRARIVIGDYVLLTNNRYGLVQYHGKTRFSIGYWYGIELIDATITRHNGMVLNKRYFTCPANKGLFVRRECIIKIIEENKVNDVKSNLIKLSKYRKKKKRTPKYRLEKEKRNLKTLAMIASSENKLILNKSTLNTEEEQKQNDHNRIPIERVANELLSDNESIELSSNEAEMHLNAIVIERNLINHGNNEYRDIFIDNFVSDMNEIEYSLSISIGTQYNYNKPKQEPDEDDENYLVPLQSPSNIELQLNIYDDQDQYEYDNDDDEGYADNSLRRKHKLLNRKQIKYLLIRRGLIPCIVYAVLNGLIVIGIWQFFDAYQVNKEYWNLDINEVMNGLFGVSWILMADLLITTILESISIWFFIATFVSKDLKKGKISGLHNSFDIDRCNCSIFCIVKLMRNGLKSLQNEISCCHRCARKIISTFMCLIFSLIVFYIPIGLILCIFIDDQFIINLDYIQMIFFKACYGGIIALILSPFTAFITLTSNAICNIASEYDPEIDQFVN